MTVEELRANEQALDQDIRTWAKEAIRRAGRPMYISEIRDELISSGILGTGSLWWQRIRMQLLAMESEGHLRSELVSGDTWIRRYYELAA